MQRTYLSLNARIAQSSQDRTTLLLGLAHDLSAPVSRLTMAVELEGHRLSADRHAAMTADLSEMRCTIEQFLGAAGCLGSGAARSCTADELLAWVAASVTAMLQRSA